MSISPPSDIVLDVARAADPARYTQAAAKLGQPAAAAGADFSDLLGANATLPVESLATAAARLPAPGRTIAPEAAKAFQSFEAMTLATMIEQAMPNSESVFGEGTAGNVWKSMLSDKIAEQMARAGGIGIAAQLAAVGDLTGSAASGDAARALILGNTHAGFLDTVLPSPDADKGA